jgi:hypothetical protein
MTEVYGLKTKPVINRLIDDSTVSMRISGPVLEDVCKKMIEILLYCLPQAIHGTVYTVGPIPQLRVVRVGLSWQSMGGLQRSSGWNSGSDGLVRRKAKKLDC